MGLAEALAARIQGQGRTAQVTCGELGSVTVEALPLRELEQLLRRPDGPRAVFYAACRELQKAGEEFRKAGKFYTPDQIVQFVSESEAQTAAKAVLSLSGWEGKKMPEVRLSSMQETAEETASKAEAEPEEVRLSSVRDEPPLSPVPQDIPAVVPAETRPEPVRLSSAGIDSAGQASYETAAEAEDVNEAPLVDKKAQALDESAPEQAHNVASNGEDFSVSPPNDHRAAEQPRSIKSETPQAMEVRLHETKSDFDAEQAVPLHKIKSDFLQSAGEDLHESKSAFPEVLHETESELPKSVHKSELNPSESLRETEPDSAERLAKALLDGLRRAKWVRGG